MTESRRDRTEQNKKRSSILSGIRRLSLWISKKAKSGLFGNVSHLLFIFSGISLLIKGETREVNSPSESL